MKEYTPQRYRKNNRLRGRQKDWLPTIGQGCSSPRPWLYLSELMKGKTNENNS